jgi:hypothetical protein
MAGSGCDIRYDKSNQNVLAIERLLVEELAASILELPNRRWAQIAAAATGEIETPLAGSSIVETQTYSFDAPCWAIDDELQQICLAIPDTSNNGSSFVLNPCGRTGQGALEAPQVSAPSTNLKVEVVLSVSPLHGLTIIFPGWGRTCLGERLR